MTIRLNTDITIVEGGTFNSTYQWKTGSPSLPVDLTGYTAVGSIRSKLTDVAALLAIPNKAAPWAADGDTGIYIYPNGSPPDDQGKWRIYLKDDDTKGLCTAHKDIVGVYDVFLYSPAGEAVFQQYGVATIKASSTGR
jgi:hypothetical protein